jgi:hypothetical protein
MKLQKEKLHCFVCNLNKLNSYIVENKPVQELGPISIFASSAASFILIGSIAYPHEGAQHF